VVSLDLAGGEAEAGVDGGMDLLPHQDLRYLLSISLPRRSAEGGAAVGYRARGAGGMFGDRGNYRLVGPA
jgi:hypothetical protein